ncbi:hypothetical protein [Microcystis aeruginosa]|nr:hypothetical protein [Microcystis aeruginosa]MDB9422017.1 hypothetical protein [Microcystis aeruginosa CS-563/04]
MFPIIAGIFSQEVLPNQQMKECREDNADLKSAKSNFQVKNAL